MRVVFKILFIFLCSGKIFAQEDPSSWPVPTSEIIKTGFYNNERLEKYWHWKKSTLQDLYLVYNHTEITHSEIKWKKNNFQHRFTFVNFPLEFIVDNQPTKKRYAEIGTFSRNAVDTLKTIEPSVFKKAINEQNVTQENICFTLENQFRDIYILWFTDQKDKIASYKVTHCRCEFEGDGQ